jgi:hypothetical protein
VQAITWWDLSDGGWLHAPAGLLHKDHTPKPAYNALLQLIKGDWWLAPTRLVTDASGQFTFSGFLGDYEVSLGNRKTIFSLKEKGAANVSIDW